ncbi:hypothetical protein EsVE80_03550 [Enterococcus saigonensis]|uniref:Uncharacterized protein n=1 Tax=Enterococcus saigonensis TaxID=1805431 RepID=A0A679IG80_9ENTE|nr:cell wall synthase accessory phosphoprotein MacP [Enterococcus saigonensis]BCA84832.1 hypothetical protein EsVE80_03550 [Enterococcus saigonensis]
MSKGPLVTRSELRRQKEKNSSKAGFDEPVREKNTLKLQKEYERKDEKIKSFYRKEAKKQKELTKTRSGESRKSRELNSFLVGAIIVVSLLIGVVLLATFFL